jgi:acetylornithine deacetylase/succinyl-diaminopimelate desuccinylase-like protein
MLNDFEKLISNLVAINSVFPNEKQLGEYLFSLFKIKKYKPLVQSVEKNRFNIIVEKGNRRQSIVLYSHLDTVGVSDGWKINPLKLTIRGDRGYGLGSWDMKGGMAVNILTFLNFSPKKYRLKLVFCVDEENISKGAYRLLDSDFIKDVQCVISTEPAFKYGIRGIAIGRIGRVVYRVEIIAPSRHFAFYDAASDINLFLAEFLTRLRKINKTISKEKKQFIFARKIVSQSIGMSLPQKTVIELDSSIISPQNSYTILNKIKNIALKTNSKFANYFKINVGYLKRDTPFLESYEIDKNNLYLKLLKQSINEITNKNAQPYFRCSVADENVFAAQNLPVLGIGPEGGHAHAPNEWVSLKSLEKLYQILNNFLSKVDKNI